MMTRRLAAILAADVAGFSALMERDEEGTFARVGDLRRNVIAPALAAEAGRLIKTTGDGFLAEFASPIAALRCALAIQDKLGTTDGALRLRIGLNLGDVIVEDGGDVYGEGVNIAARLEALAEPGGILISGKIHAEVEGKVAAAFDDRGEQQVKNITRPVRVFAVRAAAPAEAPPRAGAAPDAAPALQVPDKPSIAVLPFQNMSSDPDQDYFADGIVEDIITALSRFKSLFVIARNSSFTYKGKPVDVKKVGRELGVRYVLEGSVRKAGNRVRVTAQLIDSTTDGHVWASRFDRELTDIFTIQDELTKEIVAALKLKLTLGEQDRLNQKREVKVEAFELFLRGREQAWTATRTGGIAARGLLERAIAIEPNYPAAHALIAATHLIDYANGFSSDPEQSLRTGFELAQRVVRMDETDPAGHFALCAAYMWTKDLDRAQAEAQRCLELSPNSADSLRLTAQLQIFSGDPAAAIENIELYMKRDPHYPDIALQLVADARFALGQYEPAIAALEQRLARNAQSETAYALLASCYGQLGRSAECRAAWAQTLRINPGFSMERRRRVLPFRKPEDFERRVEGLRKGGVTIN
ncbi:MAG: tetratricopeptide repeat protein [Roseiarcus sp.]